MIKLTEVRDVWRWVVDLVAWSQVICNIEMWTPAICVCEWVYTHTYTWVLGLITLMPSQQFRPSLIYLAKNKQSHGCQKQRKNSVAKTRCDPMTADPQRIDDKRLTTAPLNRRLHYGSLTMGSSGAWLAVTRMYKWVVVATSTASTSRTVLCRSTFQEGRRHCAAP